MIVKGLFSANTSPHWVSIPFRTNSDQTPTPFTLDELRHAATKLPAEKSPGPDGMFNEVISAVVRWNPFPLLRALNTYLSEKTFLMVWKRARVLLLHKGPSKPIEEPSSYRPTSLLDGVVKLLERLILNQMAKQVTIGLAPNHFGFHPSRGTIKTIEVVLGLATDGAKGMFQDRHLCVLVTLVIRNDLIRHRSTASIHPCLTSVYSYIFVV